MNEQKGRILNIDMDEELKAIEEGQCGLCRVGATHQRSDDCINTLENRYSMADCDTCKHRYCTDWFVKCPICFGVGKENIRIN